MTNAGGADICRRSSRGNCARAAKGRKTDKNKKGVGKKENKRSTSHRVCFFQTIASSTGFSFNFILFLFFLCVQLGFFFFFPTEKGKRKSIKSAVTPVSSKPRQIEVGMTDDALTFSYVMREIDNKGGECSVAFSANRKQ